MTRFQSVGWWLCVAKPHTTTTPHRGAHARCRVPGDSGGVSEMFGEAEHSRYPTPKGYEVPASPRAPHRVTAIERAGCSTGGTCCTRCVCRGKSARCRVPKLCSGVYCFFDFVEKTVYPTRMGSVREPGYLTPPTRMGWHAPACMSCPFARRVCRRGTR
jgi:hypothetical protein